MKRKATAKSEGASRPKKAKTGKSTLHPHV
jgi:hypothetical protein